MKHIALFILVAFYFNDIFSQDIIVKLSYRKDENNTVWTNGIDVITIKRNRKKITSVLTDKNGIARIPKTLMKDGNDYDLSLTSIGVEENYLTTIDIQENDTVFINFPKKYEIRFGYAICPKCHKSKNVCKISSEPILIRRIEKGDTTYSPIDNRTYYLGTSVWSEFNPNWYCKKDSIMF